MPSSQYFARARARAARSGEFRCCYCRCPTASTVEHVDPRSKGGAHVHEDGNLRVCCPYCNRKKGNRSLHDFLERELWRLERPGDLPGSVRAMLAECFGFSDSARVLHTGSTNAKLEISAGVVHLLVRAHSQDRWRAFELGSENAGGAAVNVCWDFLARHDCPARPRERRPPAAVFKARHRAPRR